MEVILVQCRDPILDLHLFDSIVAAAVDMPPLGLLYLGTVLQEEGFDVSIVDMNILHSAEERQRAEGEILEQCPGMLGISAMTPTYPEALRLGRRVRQQLAERCVVVMGGYHPIFLPEDALLAGGADVVIRGEAERILPDVARVVASGSYPHGLERVSSISFLVNGQPFHNPPPLARVAELDAVPFPDRNLVDFTKYRNPSTVVSSRGCMARCSFCAAGAWGGMAMRSPANVAQEVERMIEAYGFRHIFFVDNTFTVSKRRTLEILERLDALSGPVTFGLETRAPQVDEDLIRALAQKGCVAIQFGVESGNVEILRKARKGITLSQVESATALCLQWGIRAR
jgi:radical SAM superfamily enzyme YgiQ (UPF0313 family)